MQLACPQCMQVIPVEEINIKADLAKCTSCSKVFKINDLIELEDEEQFSWNPPAESKMQIEKKLGGDVEIKYPSVGWKGFNWILFGFSGFWLSFVAVWTSLALFTGDGDFPFMALFSIPFWIVGFGMLAAQLHGVSLKQALIFSNTAVEIKTSSIIRKKATIIPYNQIKLVRFNTDRLDKTANQLNLDALSKAQFSNDSAIFGYPEIVYDNGRINFMNNAQPAEKKWIFLVCRAIVTQKHPRIIS